MTRFLLDCRRATFMTIIRVVYVGKFREFIGVICSCIKCFYAVLFFGCTSVMYTVSQKKRTATIDMA